MARQVFVVVFHVSEIFEGCFWGLFLGSFLGVGLNRFEWFSVTGQR